MVNWETPPPQSRNAFGTPALFLAEAAEMRANPGKWALLDTRNTAAQASSLATSIRSNGYTAFKRGKWEAVSRTVDNEHRVYVRFMGDD